MEDINPGCLPKWGSQELPEPRRFNFRNIILVVGPGIIALSLSLGAGEWLLGPGACVKYGVALLWITLIAVILQTLLNIEFVRYIYTQLINYLIVSAPSPPDAGAKQ